MASVLTLLALVGPGCLEVTSQDALQCSSPGERSSGGLICSEDGLWVIDATSAVDMESLPDEGGTPDADMAPDLSCQPDQAPACPAMSCGLQDLPDGCGGVVQVMCSCQSGFVCDTGQCIEEGECTLSVQERQQLCSDRGAQCEMIQVDDACGLPTQIECATCPGEGVCFESACCEPTSEQDEALIARTCAPTGDEEICERQVSVELGCGLSGEVSCGSCSNPTHMCIGNRCVAPSCPVSASCGLVDLGTADALRCGNNQGDCSGQRLCSDYQCAPRLAISPPQLADRNVSAGEPSWFGIAMAMRGDMLVVGEPGTDDGGMVHVYVRDAYSREFLHRQSLSNPAANDPDAAFGASLAIHDDGLVVGAPGVLEIDGSETITIDAPQGKVYVFEREVSTGLWGVSATTLPEPDPEAGSTLGAFGYDVAIEDDLLVVGSPLRQAIRDGDQETADVGGVFLYDLSSGSPSFITELPYADRNDLRLGFDVDIEQGFVLAGAPETTSRIGAVYLWHEHSSGMWRTRHAPIRTSTSGSFYGHGVALNASHFYVGAPDEALTTGEVEGYARMSGDRVTSAFAVFSATGGRLGARIAVSDAIIVVSAPGHTLYPSNAPSIGPAPAGAVFVRGLNSNGEATTPAPATFAPDAGDVMRHVGMGLAIHDRIIAIGAPHKTEPDDSRVYLITTE